MADIAGRSFSFCRTIDAVSWRAGISRIGILPAFRAGIPTDSALVIYFTFRENEKGGALCKSKPRVKVCFTQWHRPLVAGPLQEMDKDLPAGRVKIDRPVVPFRGKFIGCPYRSLLCPTYALTKSGGKFYKWNSSGFARGVPSVRGNLSTWLSRSSLCVTGFFLYGENTETERRTMGSSRLFGLVVSKYIREEIFEFRYFLSFFDFFRLFTRYPRLSKAVEY